VSEKVTTAVFGRMRAERERRTLATIAEGSAEAKRIRNDAVLKESDLLAVARARATVIRGRGDAEAAKYYEMLEADPALAMFLRNTEALKNILGERSTYIVPTDMEPFTLLKEIPDIRPAESE
jgi:membrane protease subunit HflC